MVESSGIFLRPFEGALRIGTGGCAALQNERKGLSVPEYAVALIFAQWMLAESR